MDHYEYMQLTFDIIPQEIINGYNLTEILHNGKFYIDIRKGIYRLPQDGRIAHDWLKNHLEKHIYQPVKFTPGLRNHKYRPTSFTLIIDYPGIKYFGNQHADHIIQELQWFYEIKIILEGKLYCELTINCN